MSNRINFDIEGGIDFTSIPTDASTNIIKVIGVGGGGGNAVRNMYQQGIEHVGFAVVNTDSQALAKSPVPIKLQIGKDGLGVGGFPQRGREAAMESLDLINELLDEPTRMVFITAGMGGGTGTGAAPIIAQAARDKGILTVGVVTLPFKFEKAARIEKALIGVEELRKHVDAILVINNERLMEIYSDGITTFTQAFEKADEVLTTATKSIAEVITVEGLVNRDFMDVQTVMKDSGAAIMAVGYGTGEHRILHAMQEAITSPLIRNADIERAQRLLYIIYTGTEKPVTISESNEINDFMDTLSDDLEVLWGLYPDDSLKDEVKVTIIATGFDRERAPKPQEVDEQKRMAIEALKELYYPTDEETPAAEPEPEPEPEVEEPETQEYPDEEPPVTIDLDPHIDPEPEPEKPRKTMLERLLELLTTEKDDN